MYLIKYIYKMTRTSTRNIMKPVRYSEESEKYLKGRYHGWKDTWDRNYNGHIKQDDGEDKYSNAKINWI